MRIGRSLSACLILALTVTCGGTALAQFRVESRIEREVPRETVLDTPAQAREAMVQALISIEQAAGLPPKASQGIAELDALTVKELFSAIENRGQFIASAELVQSRILETRQALEEAGGTAAGVPFYPTYPAGVSYQTALLFGLVDSPDDRCGGSAFDAYESVLAGAAETLAAAEVACAIGSCEPTGIACAITCIPSQTVMLAFRYASIPLEACKAHGGGVDSAEIEAGFENSIKILSDLDAQAAAISGISAALAAHDANIDGDLVDHDARIAAQVSLHDADIKALLADLLENQAEIIKLLKTPQGRRPGWGTEGY